MASSPGPSRLGFHAVAVHEKDWPSSCQRPPDKSRPDQRAAYPDLISDEPAEIVTGQQVSRVSC